MAFVRAKMGYGVTVYGADAEAHSGDFFNGRTHEAQVMTVFFKNAGLLNRRSGPFMF